MCDVVMLCVCMCVQLSRIYLDMLNVYKVISENVSVAIATNGENVTKQPLIKSMRTVKKETLKLISSWVGHSNDPQMVSVKLVFTVSVVLVGVYVIDLICIMVNVNHCH